MVGSDASTADSAAPQGHARSPRAERISIWGGRLGRLLSLRVWIVTFIACFFLAWLASLTWEPLVNLFWVLWPVALIGSVFNDDQELRCPWCKKRVKLGATTCHHCGRVVARSKRTELAP